MSLSLEVKKFINSEQTGEYIELVLPGEVETQKRRSVKKDAAHDDSVYGVIDPDEGVSEVFTAQEKSVEQSDEAKSSLENDAPVVEPQEKSSQRRESARELYSENERARMHYVEAGDGEPLILVHTVGQSYYTWRKVFQRLSEHYRVIAVDLFGHGYSDRPSTFGYTIEEHADSLRLFMDAMGIKSAHFMAFSMSWAYVTHLAIRYPERIGKMVLLTPGGITPEMPLTIRMIDSSVFGFFASRLYSMRSVDNMLQESFFDLTNITPDVVQEYYRPASDSEGRRAIRMSLQYFDDADLLLNLRNIKAETLILQGSEDKWHVPKQIELFHSSIKNAGFAFIRNAGHLIQEEKPDRIISALLEFIPVEVDKI